MTSCGQSHPGTSCWRTAPGGYCLPPRCYCGSCPWYLTTEELPTYTPDLYTAIDRGHILSSTGRRTSLVEYRAEQASARQFPGRSTGVTAGN